MKISVYHSLGHCNTVNYRENPVSKRTDDGRTGGGRAAKRSENRSRILAAIDIATAASVQQRGLQQFLPQSTIRGHYAKSDTQINEQDGGTRKEVESHPSPT